MLSLFFSMMGFFGVGFSLTSWALDTYRHRFVNVNGYHTTMAILSSISLFTAIYYF